MPEPDDQPQSVKDLPEWAQREITQARSEAQSLRNRLRETEGERDAANSRIDELTQQHQDQLAATAATADAAETARLAAESNLAKTNLAVERGLPLTVVKLIAGTTDEEWKESADALAALRMSSPDAVPRQPDPAQAADPEVDPRLAVADAFFGTAASQH